MPDLADVEGFPASVALKPGAFSWSLDVSSRPGWYAVPAVPVEGQVVRTAARSGTVIQ